MVRRPTALTAKLRSRCSVARWAAAIALLACLAMATGCGAAGTPNAASYDRAWSESKAVPLPTAQGRVTSMDEAYAFGESVAAGLPVAGERFGYKFGCGADVCPFAQHIPLVGTLWKPMVSPSGATIDNTAYVRGFVEGEIAFRISRNVDAPVDAAEARTVVDAAAPAVELPDFPFGDHPLNETPIADVVAANGIARGVVIGTFMPIGSIDVDSIAMTGTRDGEAVLAGDAHDVTGGSHWKALAMAIRLLLEHGRPVEAGDVIITGTLGEPTPHVVGSYALDFGKLGRVGFTSVS